MYVPTYGGQFYRPQYEAIALDHEEYTYEVYLGRCVTVGYIIRK